MTTIDEAIVEREAQSIAESLARLSRRKASLESAIAVGLEREYTPAHIDTLREDIRDIDKSIQFLLTASQGANNNN